MSIANDAVQSSLASGVVERSPLARRPRRGERLAEFVVRAVAMTSIASIILILIFVAREAIPIFTSDTIRKEVTPTSMVVPFVQPDGTSTYSWQPVSEIPKYNLVPLAVGSLKVTFIALLISAPLSVLAAVYVSEFARRREREIVKPVLELLAGIPSVVIGFFALIVLATWVQNTFGTEHRLNALVAGIGLSLAVCPLIFTVSEDALRAVPTSYRSAALALGSDRFQMISRVVLPAAMPGILASIVLGFGRAIGETMIVVLASGNAALVSGSIGVSTRTITATIAQELGEVVVGSPHYHVLFALGALLFLSTFVLNLMGERVIHGLRKKLGDGMTAASMQLQRGKAAQAPEAVFKVLTAVAALLILLMLVLILGDIILGGMKVLSWEFISAPPREGMTAGGIFPAIFGTVALTLLMTVAAVPAGVLTALYLTEYAPPRSRIARAIRVCIANLAGVPSIVFGLFGLGFFISTVGKAIDSALYDGKLVYGKPSLIWASLTLAILTLPVVVVSTEEALRAVPREIRDASLALGATKLQTVTRVVLPEALGGVLTGSILAISRGAGEVAPIMFTGAAYFLPYLPGHLNDQFMNLSYHVYVLATQSPDVDRTKPLLYGTVLVLLLLTFLLNLVAVLIRARTRAKLKAGG